MSYKVQFLDDAEFERLPAVNIQSKVGVAYPETGEAYVRRTGVNVIDVFTAMHELEHLEGESHGEYYDSENKCYYKDFGQTLMAVAPIALSMFGGPLLGGIGSALSGVGGNIASGLGAISPALGGAASSIGGALGGAGNAIGGALGIGGGGGSSARSVIEQAASPGGFAERVRETSPFGNAMPNVIRTGAGGGIGSAIGQGVKEAAGGVASNAASELAQNVLGGNGGQMMEGFMNPSQGSFTPQSQSTPNVIAGASGSGSGGGPGASPGSVGGGAISKLRQYLQQQGSEGQGATSAFGGR